MRRQFLFLTIGAALALAGCEVNKSENPVAPTVAGAIKDVHHGWPFLADPGEGKQVDSTKQPITLKVGNAESNGVRQRFYDFEVATDAAFQKKVFAKSVPEGPNGQTTVQLPDKLAAERSYYWRARVQDGANFGEFAQAVSFRVFEPVVIKAPDPLSPVRNVQIDSNRPVFTFRRPAISGPAKNVRYRLEVSLSSAFSSLITVRTFSAGSSDRVSHSNLSLPWDKSIYWRVKALDDKYQGPWSSTAAFRTPKAPLGGGGGGGGTGDGSACPPPTPLSQIGILRCERIKYGDSMSRSQLVALLRASARKFNQGGLSGGKYGILRKGSGNNCGGYSCDIICVGQGTSQKQYDAIIDAGGESRVTWGSPKTYPNIRIDTCEIQ